MARRPSEPSRKRAGSRAGPKSDTARRKPSGSRRATAEQPTVEQPRRTERGPIAGERVLRRSIDDRVIGGVAGGLGRYLGVDPVVLRIAFVILTVAGGSGILLYILGWLLIPEERQGEPVGPAPRSERGIDLWVVVGVGLVGLGIILLIDRLIPWFDRITGPLILVAIGSAVLVQGMRR